MHAHISLVHIPTITTSVEKYPDKQNTKKYTKTTWEVVKTRKISFQYITTP